MSRGWRPEPAVPRRKDQGSRQGFPVALTRASRPVDQRASLMSEPGSDLVNCVFMAVMRYLRSSCRAATDTSGIWTRVQRSRSQCLERPRAELPELRQALTHYLAETRGHVSRLEQVFQIHGERPAIKKEKALVAT